MRLLMTNEFSGNVIAFSTDFAHMSNFFVMNLSNVMTHAVKVLEALSTLLANKVSVIFMS